jgi:hypothetical protein
VEKKARDVLKTFDFFSRLSRLALVWFGVGCGVMWCGAWYDVMWCYVMVM